MKKLIIAFGFVLLAGCATVGKDFSESDVASIQKGVTTEQTVLSTFGKPATVLKVIRYILGPMRTQRHLA